ncbi:MAG: metal ABC transporter substrate-binding protein [Clostridia bacterium]|nr:metal ABC transporter substrate-binding protein [Clostridia bacterium]
MTFRKIMGRLAGLAALTLLLTGCRPLVEDEAISHQTLYATFYPIYAISALILQDVPEMELHQLVQPQDGCLRNYELSDWDLYQVAYNADAVILGGRGLEQFATTLQSLGDGGPAVVTLFQNLTLNNNGAQATDEDASHLSDENPHLYLSVRALPEILEGLCAYMTALDPAFSSIYEDNLATANAQAEALISEYDSAMAHMDQSVPVALLNEALIYPATDLELNVVCRIDRESGTVLTGTEWDDALSQIQDAGTEVVLIEKQAPDAMVNRLKEQGFRVALLDILSTGREDMGSSGYFDAMTANLTAIQEVLLSE